MLKKFSVSGMSCSACSAGIERCVKKLNGVKTASVSLMEKSLEVDFDPAILSEQQIIFAVEKLGYGISLFSVDTKDDASKKLKNRFLISLIFLIPLIYLSMGGMLGLPVFQLKLNLCFQLALSLIIIAINFRFYTSGVRAAINLSPNMDTLVSLGSFSALCYSVVVTVIAFAGGGFTHAFYEASAMVLVLVTLGKWLEELSKQKTGSQIDKLSNMLPTTVTVLKGDKEEILSVSQVAVGDLIVLKTGDYSPIDGVVVQGYGSVDKSAITGESLPQELVEGDEVVSGSIVKSGKILVRAQKVGGDTLFSGIIEIVKRAGASKAPVQKLADKISAFFVPTVTAISIITLVCWLIISGEAYLSFKYAISVLVISCPCALGLATPVAIMAVTGKAATHGVLYKDAESIQNMAKINCLLLDKTATLTVGKPTVTDFANLSQLSDQEIKKIAYALEATSNHPLAQAVMDFCGNSDKSVENFEYVIGKGIKGVVDGKEYYLGNFLTFAEANKFAGKTLVMLSQKDNLLAVFALFDELKEDSLSAVTALNKMGVKTVMITGDNAGSAKLVAERLNISEYRYSVLPEGKATEVENYQKQGYYTAFCGDGINDSPALATAGVGIAVSTGTDIAIDSAGVVIAGGLNSLVDGLKLSKKAVGIIKGNLFWAFFYNLLLIPVAAGALSFIGLSLSPMLASAFMCVSSLFVVLNALRIRRYKRADSSAIGDNFMKMKIDGMMCKHCEKKVYDTLTAIEGVTAVEINLKKKIAKVEGNANPDTLKKAVEDAGYEVISID